MRQPSDTKCGWPSRYPRKQLLTADSRLRDTLSRETRISVLSFISQYLPILDFPRDVREAMEWRYSNFFEAH